MSKFIAVVLILLGGWLVYSGYVQADSLSGRTKTTITQIKNDIDGKARIPKPYLYYAAGGVLCLAGAGLLLKRR